MLAYSPSQRSARIVGGGAAIFHKGLRLLLVYTWV
jgi:hypothetical protein